MILASLLERRASVTFSGVPPSSDSLFSILGGSDSWAGIAVSENNALNFVAVYAAVRILAESVMVLPFKLFKKRANGGRDEADGEPEYWLMHDEPNPETPSAVFRETLMGHLCTWGNAYARLELDGPRVEAAWIRRPDTAVVTRDSRGRLVYELPYSQNGREVADKGIPFDRVFHIPGLSWNGLKGFSPVRMARESIGLGMALERYGSAMFGNRSTMQGFIKHPAELTPEGAERIRTQFERMHKGPSRAHRISVLDEGMEWQQVGLPNDDAQFLETRRFQVQEIARWFRIPPHMLADLERATFSNIEHQSLEFVKYSLMPWLVRWETEANRKILSRAKRRQGYYFRFVVDGLLRGDFESRMKSYAQGRQWGWLSANDVRKLEDMNPVEGGEDYLMPTTHQIVGEPPPESEPPPGEPEPEPQRSESRSLVERRSLDARWRLQRAFRQLLEREAVRLVDREVQQIRRHLQMIPANGEAAFRAWLRDFFAEHETFVRSLMGPLFLSFMEAISAEIMAEVEADGDAFRTDLEAFVEEYSAAFGKRHSGSALAQLENLLDEAKDEASALAALEQRLTEWSEREAGKIGMQESVQAMNGVAMAAYAFAGVTLWRWVWNGGDCKICPEMHGRVVEIGRPFLRKGDRVGPEDDPSVTTLVVKSVRNHPPLHNGCQCSVAPEVG